jgi:hypothetical protein
MQTTAEKLGKGTPVNRLRQFAIGAALAVVSLGAYAQNYSFSCITNNLSADCSTGEAQFGMTVSDGGDVVNFLFSNSGPLASSITDIYFDWSSSLYSLTPGVFTSSTGVSFGWGASPGDLPGGNSILFSANLATDSNSPAQPNGINSGEWLNIAFSGSYANLLTGLNASGLRVGLHTQGYQGGGSEGFVNVPAIPEPETYAMLIAGLGLMAFVARRRQRNLAAT